MSDNVFRLADFPVHLGLGASVVREPKYEGGMAWFADYGARHASDGPEGRLVSMYTFDASWTSWEVHPRGDELVVCVEGTLTVIQELSGEQVPRVLTKGEAVINPAGVWHTADCDEPCTALFITAGEGTNHRPR